MVLKYYLKALRMPFITASGLNFAALWIYSGYPVQSVFIIALLGVIFAHLSGNLWNDYFDFETDKKNLSPTPFSGGSRLLQDNQLSKKAFFIFSLSITIIAMALGVILFFYAFQPLLMFIVVFISGLLLFFYTAPPIKLVYRKLGEIAIVLDFGFLIYLGIYSLWPIPFQLNSCLLSVILGLLTARILFINQILDYDSDKLSKKYTLANWIPYQWIKIFIPVFSLASIALLFLFAKGYVLWFSVALLMVSEIMIIFLENPKKWAAIGLISHFLFTLLWII